MFAASSSGTGQRVSGAKRTSPGRNFFPALPEAFPKVPLDAHVAPGKHAHAISKQSVQAEATLKSTGGRGEAEPEWVSSVSPRQPLPAAGGLSVSAVIPPAARQVFPFDFFNPMQTKSFDAIFNTSDNALIAAPTSSGKTALLELAIVRQVLVHGDTHKTIGQRGKAVYLAPMRAIVEEVACAWKTKFASLGLTVASLLSSTNGHSDAAMLQSADIVCATPEKWDAITRTWKSNKALMGQVSLLLLDEVHFVGDERGAVLEAIVSRMQAVSQDAATRQANWPAASLRTVALSATLPNVQSISRWLEAKQVLRFGDEFRPVPLSVSVLGFGNTRQGKEFLHEQGLNKHVFSVIQEYAAGKPSLVFCPTRRGTHAVAKQLCLDARMAARQRSNSHSQSISAFVTSPAHQHQLAEAARDCSDSNLRECMLQGVGFHTAGLTASDRATVEQAFRAGLLGAMATTTTLSQGVNLPAHLVVVKSTMQWRGSAHGGYQQYDLSTVLQMIGRAGRPQFDDSGVAVILTENKTKDVYLKMSSGALQIQSFLRDSMVEILNTEVALGTVCCLADAERWLKTTFLWHCIDSGPGATDRQQELLQAVSQAVTMLSDKGFLKHEDDQTSQGLHSKFAPSLPCRVASKHALSVHTVEHLIRSFVPHLFSGSTTQEAPQASVTEELFWHTVCHSQEFSRSIRLRQGDKKALNALLRSKQTRWSLPSNRVKSLEDKVFVLVQLKLGGVHPGSYDLQMDSRTCVDVLSRIAKALVSILSSEEVCSSLVVYAHTMHRCAVHGLWSTDPLPLRQLESLRRHSKKLNDLNITSFADIVRLHEVDLREFVKLPQAVASAAATELGGVTPLEVRAEAAKQPSGTLWDVIVTITAAVPRRLSAEAAPGHEWKHGWLFWLFDVEGSLVAKQKVKRYDDAELVLTVPEAAIMNHLTLCVQHCHFLSMDVIKTVQASMTGAAAQAAELGLSTTGDLFGSVSEAPVAARDPLPPQPPRPPYGIPEKPVSTKKRQKRESLAQSDLISAFARVPKCSRKATSEQVLDDAEQPAPPVPKQAGRPREGCKPCKKTNASTATLQSEITTYALNSLVASPGLASAARGTAASTESATEQAGIDALWSALL